MDTSFLSASASTDADVAIVIDVLRASSVMVAALAAGARRVITTREVDDARDLAEEYTSDRDLTPLLCGERQCTRIEGFDLGNSPASYTASRVKNRDLILTTTNGTQAIAAAASAKEVWIGCFLNLSAIARSLPADSNVDLICAGTNGSITMEDVLFAGAVLSICDQRFELELNDESIIARQLWRSSFGRETMPSPEELSEVLKRSQGGRNLVRVGYESDIGLCANVDAYCLIPKRVHEEPAVFAVE
ncbi:2-phosphosulfolactate phosphatase [Novipirellula aureliae]|nr:2-phosphosulfolactate phosphatase [Novipirellula aureliae]